MGYKGGWPVFEYPLHIAAGRNYPGILGLLLDHGADIKQQDGQHQYPIHLAASTGSLEAAQRLLEAGADVDGPHHDSVWSPLAIAAWYGHHDVVKVLLNHGADVNRNLRDWQAVQRCVKFLNSGEEGFTALHRLVTRMSLNSPSFEWQDESPDVCLEKEPWTHQWERIFRLFLEHGADPTLPDYKGRSAKYIAQSYGMVEVLELLREKYPWQDVGYEHWKARGYEKVTGRDITKQKVYVTEEKQDRRAWRAKRRACRQEMMLNMKACS